MHPGKPGDSKPQTSDESQRSRRRRRWDDDVNDDLKFFACFGRTSIGAVPTQELEGWRQVAITIDSGAAESVADPKSFPGYSVRSHPAPRFYQSATGEPIKNVGEQTVA